jgi:quinol---cytochrome-c reductase cytochrome c subunit
MRRARLLALVAAAAAVAVGIVPAAAQPPPNGLVRPHGGGGVSVARGAELYAGNCSSCHGVDGRGITSPRPGAGDIGGAGPDLRGVGAMAPDFYLRTGRMPINHPGEQPERNRPYFSDPEIRSLVRYVASLGKGPAIPDPHPGGANLSHGQQLFTDHCAGCHQIVGEGGYVTGARVPVLQHATPTQIAEAVRIGPFLMPSFSPRTISKRQLDDIVAYVQYAKHPDDRGGLGLGHIGPVPEGMVPWVVVTVILVGLCILLGERLSARRYTK